MTALRVAVDATSLLGTRTGVAAFTGEIIERIDPLPDVAITAYAVTWRGRHRLPEVVPPSVHTVDRALPALPLRLAWKWLSAPRLDAALGEPDVVHGPNFVLPPTRAGGVVTVHDLTCVRYPELCANDVLDYPRLIERAVRRGAVVHAVSQSVADEVADHFPVRRDQVVAIPNGVDEVPWAEPGAGRRIAAVERYVLAVGTIEPRKDHATLVRAFEGLADHDPDLGLVLAGAPGWAQGALDEALEASRHRARIRLLGWVDHATRAALLRDAAVLAYPSLYEGFGLPPLEAMQVGVPVVTTTAGAIPEVVGDAAVLVPPGDAEALTDAIGRALGDDALRTRLVDAGKTQAAAYDWDRTASGLVELYRAVAR